jgi:hypothetical protein
MDLVNWKQFQTCVERYHGDYRVRQFRCSDYFRVMAFAQLTYRESLRDIVNCLRAMPQKRYHMGIRSPVSLNNLSNAAQKRDWRIFADFAKILIERAHVLYKKEDNPVKLKAPVFALDSTTINLCLSLFPWAPFRKTKAAIKLHTLLNLQGNIPDFILISNGKMHDVNVLDDMVFVPGGYYVMDRGYLDFERLYKIHQAKSFFITRAKRNTKVIRQYSKKVDKTIGIQSDQIVVLTNPNSNKTYPEQFRRIRFYDVERNKRLILRLIFLTNNITLPAKTIADLYKSRWRVELFFKWIKQHLRIKVFYGTSENAVKSQIWIAICIYLIITILKKEINSPLSLYQILQILSLIQFEKTPIFQALDEKNVTIQLLNPNNFALDNIALRTA